MVRRMSLVIIAVISGAALAQSATTPGPAQGWPAANASVRQNPVEGRSVDIFSSARLDVASLASSRERRSTAAAVQNETAADSQKIQVSRSDISRRRVVIRTENGTKTIIDNGDGTKTIIIRDKAGKLLKSYRVPKWGNRLIHRISSNGDEIRDSCQPSGLDKPWPASPLTLFKGIFCVR